MDLDIDGNGLVKISGVLDHDSVPILWEKCSQQFTGHTALQFDLGLVERSNSAGLALLIACMREAVKQGKSVRFLNIPEHMQDIARVSGLDEMLLIHEP